MNIYLFLWIAIAVLLGIIIVLFFSFRNKLSGLATVAAKALIDEQAAKEKLKASETYKSAWFLAEVSKHLEEEKKAEQFRQEHPGFHVDRWDNPHPADTLSMERDMKLNIQRAATDEEAVSILAKRTPAVITSLMETRFFMRELSGDELQQYRALLQKYGVQEPPKTWRSYL